MHPAISLSDYALLLVFAQLDVCLQVVFTRRMNASLSSSFFLFWFLCWVFGGAMLILGLKDIAIVSESSWLYFNFCKQ
jgi:hypothetical protein